ncbi:MAG: hypothetical protein FWD57_11680, partial [Polyangiaceae bacterium]|nr:hypothetical protein [Polyangiaceae bacterium]
MATSYFKHAILIAVGLSVPVVAVAMRGCEATDGDPTDAGEAESSQQEAAPSSTSTHDPDASKKPDAKPDSGGKGGSGGSGGSDSDVVEPPKECDSQPIPSTVPKGWEEYPVMDCKYRLYVPSSPEYLPSPLVWEPCSSKTGPLSYNCRQIKMDWPSKQPAPYGIAGLSYAHVDGDGKVLLQFRKLYEQPGQASTGLMAILVEADGPVRQALWRDYSSMYSKAIYVDPSSVTSGKSSWTINEVADNKSIRVAALGGGDTLLRPPVLHDLPNGHIDSGT